VGASGAARVQPRGARALTQRRAQLTRDELPTRLAAGSLRLEGPNVVQLLQVRPARSLPPACCAHEALSPRRAHAIAAQPAL
jgi:hypothetical protein